MFKRWMAIFIILAVLSEGCSYALSKPTPIASQPGEASPTNPEVSATIPSTPTAATGLPKNTVAPNTPAAPATLLAPAPTTRILTPVAPTPIPMKYVLQKGTPLALTGFVHADLGCTWMGVGGQVFAQDSIPVEQLVVELGGTLNGQAVSQLSMTGAATQWGPGGYEFTLANHPIDSSGTLWLRVLDLNGDPVSSRIYFTTYSDCSKNTILINLNEPQVIIQLHTFLPYVGR